MTSPMQLTSLCERYDLTRLLPLLASAALPAVRFTLDPLDPEQPLSVGMSRLGGDPDLPLGTSWPTYKGHPQHFIAQIALGEIAPHAPQGLLPASGLLSFFYDLEEQPWGYDPADLDGFTVLYHPPSAELQPTPMPPITSEYPEDMPLCAPRFSSHLTLPHPFSRAFARLEAEAEMTDAESNRYWDLLKEWETQEGLRFATHHRLLGHSSNVQGDMQLEAQLVTNGLYCGNSSGYQDPRAAGLAPGADEWVLLFQLDSDDQAGLLWGDNGMLYYWIRRDDLRERRFDRVWMTMQCY